MSLYQRIKQLDQKFSWSFFGFVLSILFFLFGLYTTFIYQKKPKLVFEELSEAPVYSVNESVSNLDIIFQGEDIRKKKQTLTLLTLRAINNGNASILINTFDPQYLPFVSLQNCQIIKVDPINASSEYLQKAAHLIQTTNNQFFVSPVMIGSGDFFDSKFLLLHDEGAHPALSVGGTLAEQPKIEFLSLYSKKEEMTFWHRVLGGNFFIQVLRIVVYTFGTLIGILTVVLISVGLKEAVENLRRKRIVRKFKMGSGLTFSELDECVFAEFVSAGEFFLLRLSQLLQDEEKLPKILDGSKNLPVQGELLLMMARENPGKFPEIHDATILKFATDKKIVEIRDGVCLINQSVKSNVQQFLLSLSLLSPKRIQAARSSQETYGTESKQVKDIDRLTATGAGNAAKQP